MSQLPASGHSHGHICFMDGCEQPACQKIQRDAQLYGFDEDGEVAKPEPVRLPWEDQDAA